jgi:hypothetical protein
VSIQRDGFGSARKTDHKKGTKKNHRCSTRSKL